MCIIKIVILPVLRSDISPVYRGHNAKFDEFSYFEKINNHRK